MKSAARATDRLQATRSRGRRWVLAASAAGLAFCLEGFAWALDVIDPAHEPTNAVPPAVHFERVVAKRIEFLLKEDIEVRPGTGQLELDLTALNFLAPAKMQFQYRLAEVDRDWINSEGRRKAIYSNLKPGLYHFQVIPANSDGVWNSTGDAGRLESRPHFRQTAGFYLLCGGLGLALIGGSYLLRVRHLKSNQSALQKIRGELEIEVKQRTAELAKSVSVLNAAIESTADGLLIIDCDQQVVSFNRKFLEMWHIPPEIMATGRDDEVLLLAVRQVKEEATFLSKVQELYRQPDLESFDIFELKDGRIFERYSIPQRLGADIVGRVWSFRDVTERKKIEREIVESRNFLDRIINSIGDPIFVKDERHRGVLVNDAFCSLMGCSREELLGKSDHDHTCYSNGEADTFKSQDQIVLETGRENVNEETLTSTDGKIHHLITKKTLYLDESGGKFIVGVARDVTNEKKIERELVESRNFLDRIINSISDPIYVKDRQHRWVLVNDAACSFVGANRPEIVGKTARELFPKAELDAVWAKEAQVFEAARERITEETFTDLAGNQHAIICKKNLYVDDNGESFIVAVIQDITERKNAEAELRWKTAFLEALLASSIDAVLVVNDQGRKVYQNQRVLDLWKIPSEIANDPDDAKQVQCVMNRVRNPQQFVDEIKRLYGKPNEVSHDEIDLTDGTILDRHSYPVVGQDGTRYGRIWQFRDVTQRKRAEAELAYERDLLCALLDSTPDAIYFKDQQSRFLRCSRSMARQFNVREIGEMIGKADLDYFTEEHALQAFEDEQRIMRTGEPVIARIEKETWADKRVTWALTSKMPLRNVQGEIVGTLGISKDITQIKVAEAKLNDAHRQLLEISRQAGMAEVATGVLHNVGNVLNSVNVSTTLLAEQTRKSRITVVVKAAALLKQHEADLSHFLSCDPKGQQLPSFLAGLAEQLAREQAVALEELESLQKHVNHIKEIVARQQAHAKVTGVTTIENVVELVEDALCVNEAMLAQHRVALVREFDTTVPPIVVDRHKVMQILLNLMSNAKHACLEADHDRKQVTVRLRTQGKRIHISVTDNGVGIASENLTRIFSHGFTTRKDGHGFGLHSGALVAKEIGGELRVESAGPGQGATFVLELPIALEGIENRVVKQPQGSS